MHQYSQAIANAQRATELEPNNLHPWVALAIAHGFMSEVSEAKAAYQTAISLDQRYRDHNFLDHLEQAGFSPDQIEAAAKILSAVTL